MYLDLVERWIVRTTGRTLDQHAADPIPAAVNLRAAADQLNVARGALLASVDEFRYQLINGDDLTNAATALTSTLDEISSHVGEYEIARFHLDQLINDPDRLAYAATNPVQAVQRRYVNPGDIVKLVLPDNQYLRERKLAGKRVRARINETSVELDPAQYASPVRLDHSTAGIYRDRIEGRLYHLRPAGDRRRRRR
ncbi:hypothetical protein [Actinoplanes sp. NPDC020271]|uniref:hypothetical protein n=1 Tax=Actinoplanes sp. NPDC020271 TaxID=3363896 RepID=UPI0037AB42B3